MNKEELKELSKRAENVQMYMKKYGRSPTRLYMFMIMFIMITVFVVSGSSASQVKIDTTVDSFCKENRYNAIWYEPCGMAMCARGCANVNTNMEILEYLSFDGTTRPLIKGGGVEEIHFEATSKIMSNYAEVKLM